MKFNSPTINFPIVLRVIGWLLLIEAGFMCAPAVVSWVYGEMRCMAAFLYGAGITMSAGLCMTFIIKPNKMTMRTREGLLLTATVWVFFAAFAMIPLLFSGEFHTITDAFFESMSGFTTTGATVLKDVDSTSHGVLLWRAIMQWIGGMGIILFTLAVLPMFNFRGGIAMFNAEVTGITHERMRPRVSQTAMTLWGFYIALTVALFVLLLFGPMNWFDALCHSLATVSTGGFSTHNEGLAYWHNYYSDVVIMVFMLFCGTNLTLLFRMFTSGNGIKNLFGNDTFKWYIGTFAGVSLIILARMTSEGFISGNWPDRFLFAAFDTLSAITSTGFSTWDYESSGEFISFVLMVVMFFGGMAGSTSGGAKIDRMIVMIKNTRNQLFRLLHPNAVTVVRVDGKAMSNELVNKVIAFLTLYVMIIVAMALVLSLMGLPIFDSLFTSMSALSNVGYGYGLTGDGAFGLLPDAAKWLLSFEMLVGRLELFTVMVMFSSKFWVKD